MTLLKAFRVVSALVSIGLVLSAHLASAASPILQLTNDPGSDLRPTWSPDGKQIAFQSNRSGPFQVYVMNADGSGERPLSTGTADDRHPSWSPDGKTIAIESGTDIVREIWTVDVSTGTRSQVSRLGAVASFPSWSPDGKAISFFLYRQGAMNLWTVDADGSNPRQLTQDLASEKNSQCTFACHAASWSPDGSRLAYTSGDQMHAWTIRASDGGDAVQVSPTVDTGRSHFPIFTPDGRVRYVTEHITPGRSWTDVWEVAPGSNQPPQPVLEDVQVQGPFAFSPDGEHMLFASPRGGNFQIYLVTLDAEGKEALKVSAADAELATGAAVASASPTPAAIARPADAPAPAESGGIAGLTPYLAALGVIAALWLGVEATVRMRRERPNGRTGDGKRS